MWLVCPHCGTKTIELMACHLCEKIGCVKCMIKNKQKLVCLDCNKTQDQPLMQEIYKNENDELGQVLSTMFG